MTVSLAPYPVATPPVDTASTVRRLIITDGRPARQVDFEVAVVSYFIDAADLLGVPKSLAEIYGICFASPEPLSMPEIKARLDISAGSISQGVRFLVGIGALVDSSGPADRHSRYEPDIELRKLLLHYLEHRVERQLEAGKARIREVRQTIPRQDAAAAKLLTSRVKSLDGWHTKSRALLPLIRGALRLT